MATLPELIAARNPTPSPTRAELPSSLIKE